MNSTNETNEDNAASASGAVSAFHAEPHTGAVAIKPGTIFYAGFFKRLLAFTVDMTILSILLYVTTLAAMGGNIEKMEILDINDTQLLGKFLMVILFNHLLFFVYFVYFHMKDGQTPGKMAFNIKVIGQDGGEVGFMRSLFRTVGYTVSATFLMIGFIWPLFDKRNQAWHDKLAGTIVVETG